LGDGKGLGDYRVKHVKAAGATVLLACAAVMAYADIAPEPGSPEAVALEQEKAKTCKPGEAEVVCGVRAGVGWHPLNCEKYENDAVYYRLKSFKYEETYCKYRPGESRPKPKPPAENAARKAADGAESGLPLLEGAGVLLAMALGGLSIWVIRKRSGASA
jgi:hypothetical protein